MSKNDETSVGPVPDLERLYSGREPPAALEERVVGEFRRSSGIGARPPDRRWAPRRALLRAAAAAVLFMAGWAVGSWGLGDPVAEPGGWPTDAGAGFMLLLWEGEGFDASGAEATAAEYAVWAGSVAGQGLAISGEELGAPRTIVGDLGGAIEGPARLGSARLGGYFLVGAGSADEVRSLVRGHPHLARGGAIEIAPIVRR